MTRLRVAVSGAAGRLGSLAAACLDHAADLELTARLVRGDDPASALRADAVDVLLDLTVREASVPLACLAAERGVAPVVGTSGWTAPDVDALRAACARGGCGGLLVPNFSVGAVLQLAWAEQSAAHFSGASIHEVHHAGKLDSPSGTARRAAERMAAARGGAQVPITSERRADALAEQTISLWGEHERVELRHAVSDRRAYLPGILLAVRRVRDLDGLRIGLERLLLPRR